MTQIHKVCIVGSGPAGYTAAIYTARALLNPIMLTGSYIGGQLMTTSDVENFPGYIKGVSGPEMMEHLKEQAAKFGTSFINTDVIDIDCTSNPFCISLRNGDKLQAYSVIVATGAQSIWLNLPGEEKLRNKGYISSCAVCDGAFHKNEHLVVIGGGDSSMEEAIFLTRFAKKVTIIHRRDEFRASKIMLERAQKNKKIEWVLNATAEEWITNDTGNLTGIVLNTKNGREDFNCDSVFMAIGHKPSTEFLKDQVETNENGYILHKINTMTSVEGLFSAGDCTDTRYKQAITASADGCKAAMDCETWLESYNY
jgi:thioredoxin reductase (NADPH)